MRIIVFFDLPTDTSAQRRQYRLFRKGLIKEGYLMMQESVYSKMALDGHAADAAIARLKKNKPDAGIVQALRVTEKQFAGIEEIVGTSGPSNIISGTESVVVL